MLCFSNLLAYFKLPLTPHGTHRPTKQFYTKKIYEPHV